jgi:peptidoglycan/xylan/chitin deacetylase (PgdA/CDA1 family)
LDVFFTIDVEIWCDGWENLDANFPDAFDRYIFGCAGRGGLDEQLRILGEHGLRAVCFVEPLFAGRFGKAPLERIVALIQESGHEVQLHLHTEWVDEMRPRLFPHVESKMQYLHYFSLADQRRLIALGLQWLKEAGAPRPTAFRAGGFAFNSDTLTALADNGIGIDCSYNASMLGPGSGVCPGELLENARQVGAILELPMTVYRNGRAWRHAQLTACSSAELEGLLWQAVERGWSEFVILSHNFELLTPNQQRMDPLVVRRLRKLADLLDRHRDVFRVRTLRGEEIKPLSSKPRSLASSPWRRGLRMAEQVLRRSYA